VDLDGTNSAWIYRSCASFIHCLSCKELGRKDKVAVLVLDGEVLLVVCENHPCPKRICSVTIPENERPLQ